MQGTIVRGKNRWREQSLLEFAVGFSVSRFLGLKGLVFEGFRV